MDNIFFIVALATVLVYAFVKLRFELHMMQLNSYRNDRYFKWLKTNLVLTTRVLEIIVLVITGILILTAGTIVSSILIILLYGLLAYLLFTKKQKKPVVFTQRAQRLFGLTFLLSIIAGLVYFLVTGKALCTIWISGFVLLFSFVFIAIATILIAPVEKAINNWYYNDAKKILAQRSDLIIIGITGSYGKTSTKHFLHRMLSEKYNVLMTPGSYNTTMGVIKTVREQLQATHQVFIVEMGAKQPNDIKEICDLVNPQIGILTAVGEQHLESFKTIQNVQKTKFELIDALPSGGLAVLNADYEYIANRQVSDRETALYSSDNEKVDFYIKDISYSVKGSAFSVFQKGKHLADFETKLLGSYNLSNILAGYIVARHLEVPDSSVAFAIKKLEPVQHRLEVKVHPNGVTVIDDAFNSNPVGSKMALEVLKAIPGTRKIIITPGMIELGEKQEYYNSLLGEQIADTCDYAILVGKNITLPIMKGLKNKSYPDDKIYVAQNFKDAVNHLNGMTKAGDVLLYENDLPDTYEL
jgi:UDP-N-acetylmuramoyl-tripeptide--D-alanyl-D-alanine ligase